jgi:hypothetical protein
LTLIGIALAGVAGTFAYSGGWLIREAEANDKKEEAANG